MRWFLILLVACGRSPLPEPDALGPDFFAEQVVQFSRGDDAWSMDAVLQKQDGSLLLALRAPFGGTAMWIRHDAQGVTQEALLPQMDRIPGSLLLREVYRAYESPRPAADGRNPMREKVRERHIDTWSGSHLEQRTWPSGGITGGPAHMVRSSDTVGPWPQTVRIHHVHADLRVTIETRSWQPLPSSGTP